MQIAPRLTTSVFLALFACPAFAQDIGGQNGGTGVGMNYETRLTGLEDQMRTLNGQIEQLGYAIRRLDQQQQREAADYEARLQRLEGATAQPQAPSQPVPQQQSGDMSAAPTVSGTLGSLRTTPDGRIVGGSVNPQQPPLPDTPPDYGLSPQEQYDRAFTLLRQANYEEAEKGFKSFIDKNPKDKLLDNAKYWYGETLYVRGRFQESSVAFADAFQQNPQGSKAPDSLLKLAMSLAATDKVSDACTALSELKAKYPNASSNVRARASEEQQKFKCGA